MAKTALNQWLAPLGLAFVFLNLLTACNDSREVRIATGQVKELLFQVSYVPAHPNQTESRIQGRIEGLVAHLEQQFSSQYPDSQISRLNQWQSTQPVVLTRELEELLLAGLNAHALSGGEMPMFFHTSPLNEPASVRVVNHQLFKSTEDVQVDMELVLHGFIVDRVAHLMELMNVENYRIDINGQVRARGFDLERKPWNIDVSNGETLQLADASVGQSQTISGAHILVVHESSAAATALSAWFAAMGTDTALEKASALSIPLEIQLDENGSPKSYTSPAFQSAFSG
ncbi:MULTISPECIES: FAD:protein FMN transferase [Gammaproteobacteria]|uniref:FAD:protein FMN transferase n=1 Tax=Gammaproteobacteria TaxID=1236 RepID=UPI001402F077|nr:MULTISPECIES: FAD:protein FMN transferase [Gammaproteobacteria]